MKRVTVTPSSRWLFFNFLVTKFLIQSESVKWMVNGMNCARSLISHCLSHSLGYWTTKWRNNHESSSSEIGYKAISFAFNCLENHFSSTSKATAWHIAFNTRQTYTKLVCNFSFALKARILWQHSTIFNCRCQMLIHLKWLLKCCHLLNDVGFMFGALLMGVFSNNMKCVNYFIRRFIRWPFYDVRCLMKIWLEVTFYA